MSTICAIATGHGGAIGIIRVSGPQAIPYTSTIFRGQRTLSALPSQSIAYGTLVDGEEIVDEVLVAVYRAPHSYTGEDSTEIACHASPYILQQVVMLLLRAGCQLAQPGEFTQRAFLNGKMDLSQAEAVADLIAATSAVPHRLALSQLRGGYSTKLRELREHLLQLTALVELELDFSEEDVAFADREDLIALAQEIAAATGQLTASFRTGNALKEGVAVAIIGATNVGKSTLLNALVGDDRAIVAPTHGTTRDLVEDTLTIDGIRFRFIDTAGIRHATDSVEQMGIERTLKAAAQAQIIILLTEEGVPYPDIPVREGQTVLRRVNKTETFAAKTGEGIAELKRQLVAAVPHGESDIFCTNLRHYEALSLAHDDIARALTALREGLSPALVAEDLRQCSTHLGDIVGAVTSAEVLTTIFSHFCIGK